MMASLGGGHFHRLLEVLLAAGGTVVVLTEGYFDESGSLEEPPHIFGVSGYMIDSAAAKIMDEKWAEVLLEYNLPYFHMVDCAHGNGVFKPLSMQERIDVETKLIGLIKQYTIGGFSFLAGKDAFHSTEVEPDVYSSFTRNCVFFLTSILHGGRIEGDVAYFFESGHKNKGSAYNILAAALNDSESSSLTFGDKDKIRLLQAADILALAEHQAL